VNATLTISATCLLLILTTQPVQAGPPALEPGTWNLGPETLDAGGWRLDVLAQSRRRIRHTVDRGDTLGEIAREYGVSISDIRRWNELETDMIRIGQVLTIRTSRRSQSRSRSTYIVERGDTLSEIAQAYDCTVADILDWNPGINPDLIRVDQEISVRTSSSSGSASIGRPNRGRLSVSEQLDRGSGYRVRNPSRAYGTNESVREIERAMARVQRRFPNAPDLAIGDLSYARGGPMSPHVSHQSGRDADVSYFTLGRESGDGFVVATPENLDVRLTWYILMSFIDSGRPHYIFIDYELQAVLYDYALRRGASEEELLEWFQYPRGRDTARGLVRHSRGHDDHFHIRFDCARDDHRCAD
jgi:LysM repeat protein